MSAESMAEFYDAAEQFESSSDESDDVRMMIFIHWSDHKTSSK